MRRVHELARDPAVHRTVVLSVTANLATLAIVALVVWAWRRAR